MESSALRLQSRVEMIMEAVPLLALGFEMVGHLRVEAATTVQSLEDPRQRKNSA